MSFVISSRARCVGCHSMQTVFAVCQETKLEICKRCAEKAIKEAIKASSISKGAPPQKNAEDDPRRIAREAAQARKEGSIFKKMFG